MECKLCKKKVAAHAILLDSNPMTKQEFKAARKAKGMTQKELAAYTGSTLSAVQKWETGQNKIPRHVVEKLTKRAALTVSGLSAAEIAVLERNAARKGVGPDEYAADLIRGFLKMSLLIALGLFLAFHVSRSPKRWNAAALKQTAGIAWVKVKQLAK